MEIIKISKLHKIAPNMKECNCLQYLPSDRPIYELQIYGRDILNLFKDTLSFSRVCELSMVRKMQGS